MHHLDFLKVTIHFHHSYKQGGCAIVEKTAVLLPNHAHCSIYTSVSQALFLTTGANLAIISMILVA